MTGEGMTDDVLYINLVVPVYFNSGYFIWSSFFQFNAIISIFFSNFASYLTVASLYTIYVVLEGVYLRGIAS